MCKALKSFKGSAGASTKHSGPQLSLLFRACHGLSSVVKGVQGCRLPVLKSSKGLRGSFDQALRPQLSLLFRACPLLLRAFQAAVCQRSNPSKAPRELRPSTPATALSVVQGLPCVVKGVQGCRLLALKSSKGPAGASTKHSGHSSLCCSGPALCC